MNNGKVTVLQAAPRYGGLPTELGWKIFLDRYTVKDPDRAFQPGDLALLPVVEDANWGQKEIGRVLEVRGDVLVAEFLTGPDKDQVAEFRRIACDRPLETTLEEVARRIARAIAAVEDEEQRQRWEAEFSRVIRELRFVPGGRIWAGAGTGSELTLYNCYVIPSPHDSRQGIVQTLHQMMEIMARGGGVGINVSSLRPYRAPVRSVNGRSSGAVSWMKLYSYTTGRIEQAGARRGALMLQLDCRHPDLLQFIACKREDVRVPAEDGDDLGEDGKVRNANISVRITDAFMEAVREDREWTFWYPDTTCAEYDRLWQGDFDDWERRGLPKVIYGTRPAREVWRAICESAWASAEPGVVFIDRVERESNSWYLHRLPCSNPCGEQMLPAWGVCCLGHVHLGRHYDPERDDVDWDALRQTVWTAVRFLDNVIDATPYFFEENARLQKGERRVGLGTLGLAELLIRMRIRYGSPQAIEFCEKLYRFIAVEAYRASIELAREKGPFPWCEPAKHVQSGFMQRMPEDVRQGVLAYGIRNVTLLTQAPTGTVGTMLDTSTGIEPYYAFRYKRRSRLGEAEQEVRLVQEWREQHPGEELPDYFVTAMQLTPEEHVRMQAAVQRWVDASISKTVNCPRDWTVDDVERLYRLAYELGCKGITIYRDGSRSEQVLAVAGQDAPKGPAGEKAGQKPAAGKASDPEPFGQRRPHPRPQARKGQTIERPTGLGTCHVTVNAWQDPVSGYYGPMEMFVTVGKAGSEVQAMSEALGRVISVSLQSGVDPRVIARALRGIGGANPVGFGPARVRSVPDAVGQVLEAILEAEDLAAEHLPAAAREEEGDLDLCPQCGAPALVRQDGCEKCLECGYSRC